jgi:hypothetical protein
LIASFHLDSLGINPATAEALIAALGAVGGRLDPTAAAEALKDLRGRLNQPILYSETQQALIAALGSREAEHAPDDRTEARHARDTGESSLAPSTSGRKPGLGTSGPHQRPDVRPRSHAAAYVGQADLRPWPLRCSPASRSGVATRVVQNCTAEVEEADRLRGTPLGTAQSPTRPFIRPRPS